MRISNNPDLHLTYCTNIHTGESWSEAKGQLEKHLPVLKKRISPDQPLGVGLRLSAKAADDLLQDDRLLKFKDWLATEELYVFTINGFPYGNFHRQRVKDLVYTPDWRTPKRVDYTRNLIKVLSELLPQDMKGGISTSPISYKKWLRQPQLVNSAFRKGSNHLALLAYELAELKEKDGTEIHIDIEPEPDCLLENAKETIDFFTNHLFKTGSAFIANKFGINKGKATQIIRNHIQICYDTCHFAVEYEDPRQAIKALSDAGIKVGKTQISAALKVKFDQPEVSRTTIAKRLEQFDEPTYLHQVIERRRNGEHKHYEDLPDALTQVHDPRAKEWRIHFHVPIFVDEFSFMRSTQDEIGTSLKELMGQTSCQHYEIETYTWEVLPDNLKVDLTSSIEREFNWALNSLNK